jgi:hypothetical protein
MNYQDLEKHFGSAEKVREALGIRSRQTLCNWRKNGVPEAVQYRVQVLTDGDLKASARKRR